MFSLSIPRIFVLSLFVIIFKIFLRGINDTILLPYWIPLDDGSTSSMEYPFYRYEPSVPLD